MILWIGQIKKNSYHPINQFKKWGINFVICTDDPGVFNTNLMRERKLMKDICDDTKQ